MSAPGKFRFISTDRRVREDRRFVVGKGNFAADIVPQGVKHVALVSCPHPAARIVVIEKAAALALPGVHYVLDGTPVRACLMFAVQADGYAVTTIEGIAPGPGELAPIQDAFCETHGMQCGYCTPAMILTAYALLADNPSPTREEIVEAISANLCRCTGYAQIVEAIALAAERMRGQNLPGKP